MESKANRRYFKDLCLKLNKQIKTKNYFEIQSESLVGIVYMYMLEVPYVLIMFSIDACLVTAKLSSKSISNIFSLLDWLFFAISKCKGLHKFNFVFVRFQIVLFFLKQSEYFLVYSGYPEEEIFFFFFKFHQHGIYYCLKQTRA